MVNGAIRPGSPPDFEFNEVLPYTVNADCTGELHLTFPSGQMLTQKIVVVDNGNETSGVTSAQHNPVGAPALDGTPCDKACDVAIQTSAHFVKVDEARRHE